VYIKENILIHEWKTETAFHNGPVYPFLFQMTRFSCCVVQTTMLLFQIYC